MVDEQFLATTKLLDDILQIVYYLTIGGVLILSFVYGFIQGLKESQHVGRRRPTETNDCKSGHSITRQTQKTKQEKPFTGLDELV